jgi:hypothetical protein
VALQRPRLHGEAEEFEELLAPLLAVFDDGLITGHAGEQGDNRQGKEGGEGVPLALGTARIMNVLKEFHQRDLGFHGRVLIQGPSGVIDHRTWV